MAITRIPFESMAAFAEWAAANLVPRYFAATAYASNTLTCYRDEEKTQPLWSFTSANQVTQSAYKSASVSRATPGKSLASPSWVKTAWVCANGVMLDCGDRFCCTIITKNNRGETTTVIGGGSSYAAACTGAVRASATSVTATATPYVTAWGDDTGITTSASFIAREENQTSLVPFVNDTPSGTLGYTPYAFYIPAGQFYNMGYGTFTAGGKKYLTNGYWAILDG